jgi:hypothetical protein
MGQLYNRDWLKASMMITMAVVFMVAVKIALVRILATADTLMTSPLQLGSLDSARMWAQFLPALAHPTVQSCVHRTLLPPLVGLCAVLFWSMRDAYRRGRERVDGPSPAQDGTESAAI